MGKILKICFSTWLKLIVSKNDEFSFTGNMVKPYEDTLQLGFDFFCVKPDFSKFTLIYFNVI